MTSATPWPVLTAIGFFFGLGWTLGMLAHCWLCKRRGCFHNSQEGRNDGR